MGQLVRTVNYLINEAFHLIGEFSDGEPIDGSSFERGFNILNDIINDESAAENYIAITKEIDFNLVAGQRSYIFSNVSGITADVVSNRMVDLRYCGIVLNNYYFVVHPLTATQLYDNSFDLSVTTIPGYVFLRKFEQYSQLDFYAIPDQPYSCQIQAKFFLDQFQIGQPIVNVSQGLQDYLMYELARRLVGYYPSSNWPSTNEATYQKLYNNLMNINDIDRMVRPSTLLRYRGWYTGLNGINGWW
jgi:hypothetical protein